MKIYKLLNKHNNILKVTSKPPKYIRKNEYIIEAKVNLITYLKVWWQEYIV